MHAATSLQLGDIVETVKLYSGDNCKWRIQYNSINLKNGGKIMAKQFTIYINSKMQYDQNGPNDSGNYY